MDNSFLWDKAETRTPSLVSFPWSFIFQRWDQRDGPRAALGPQDRRSGADPPVRTRPLNLQPCWRTATCAGSDPLIECDPGETKRWIFVLHEDVRDFTAPLWDPRFTLCSSSCSSNPRVGGQSAGREGMKGGGLIPIRHRQLLGSAHSLADVYLSGTCHWPTLK